MSNYNDLRVGDVYSWGTHVAWYAVVQRVEPSQDGGTPTLRARPVGEPDTYATPAPGQLENLTIVTNDQLRSWWSGRSPEPDAETRERLLEEGRREGRRAATREFEEWKRSATETAHDYADRHELCGEFDRCMIEIGLEPRTREFVVTFEVTVDDVRDSDDAVEAAAEVIRYDAGSYVANVEAA